MKSARHTKIKEIIDKLKIETQEDLAVALRSNGIDVTQATVSRDIKELMLVKVPDADGRYVYAYPKEHSMILTPNRLTRTFQESIMEIHNNDAIIVVRTLPGTAQSVAFAVDYMKWPEILGTVAGDDTVFLAIDKKENIASVISRINSYK